MSKASAHVVPTWALFKYMCCRSWKTFERNIKNLVHVFLCLFLFHLIVNAKS